MGVSMRVIIKILVRAAAACLLLLTVWLAVELGHVMFVRFYIPRHNAYILAKAGKAPWPGAVSPGASERIVMPPLSVHWNDGAANPANEWEIPQKDETPDQALVRRAAFPGLTEEQRTQFAIGNAETVLCYNAQGTLLNVYSDWYKRRTILDGTDSAFPYNDVRDFACDASRTGRPGAARVSLCDWAQGASADFYFLPTSEKPAVYAFVKLEYAYLSAKSATIPGDSRWDIQPLRYKRNLSGRYAGWDHYKTNQYGFRAPMVSIPKPKGVFRILCIGGSTTHEGGENDATYPAVLQERLREMFPGSPIEVFNCGIEGIRTPSQFVNMPDYLEMEPDLVVAYEGINDAANELQSAWYDAYPGWGRLAGTMPLLASFLRPRLSPSPETYHGWIRDFTLTNIESFRRIIVRRGARLALCSNAFPDYDVLPLEQRRFYDSCWWADATVYSKLIKAMNQEILDYCERKRVLYIPVSENIDPVIDYLGDHCHMRTPEGIRRKAYIVAERLRDYIAPVLESLKREETK